MTTPPDLSSPDSAASPAPDISICICTYQRPEMLRRLLDTLAGHDLAGLAVQIVVADNDPAQTGIALIESLGADYPYPIVATHVAPPNISLARNAAVQAATAEWIAMIDDDEIPDPHWLTAMVATQQAFDADVVLGVVLPLIDDAMPRWLVEGEMKYWGRPRFPTGTAIPVNGTRAGSVLIRRDLVTRPGGGFDPAYGLSGGEDSMFFWELARTGVTFIWCDESVVVEEVPNARRTIEYVVRRGYLGGLSYARVELGRLERGAQVRRAGRILGSALLRWPIASGMGLVAWPRSSVRSVHWRRTAAAQRGKVVAVLAALRQRSPITDRA